MTRLVKASLFTGVALAISGGIVGSFISHRAELGAEADSDEPIKNTARVAHSGGETVVEFDAETQQRMGIRTTALATVSERRHLRAYGRLEEDPSGSFVLRAPVAGTVRADGNPWPDLGQNLTDGSHAGIITPRLLPADRVTLGDRLATARADMEAGKAAVAAAQAALDRARILNADDKNVSDRAVQEAEARVAAEQAHLTAANQTANLVSSSLSSAGSSPVSLELTRGGQVVEVLVHPGESVESGQAILRVARFDHLLARVDLPAGENVAPGLRIALILPLGEEAHPIRGQRIAVAASVDPRIQGQPFLFRIPNPTLNLRPGLSLTAYIEIPGPPRTGVVAPRSAVLWQSGNSWAYVQIAANGFARRLVVLDEPAGAGWFTNSLHPGDRVVTGGAQALLSEEFKSQIQVEEADEQ